MKYLLIILFREVNPKKTFSINNNFINAVKTSIFNMKYALGMLIKA
jgi:hypothetical protein